MSLHVRTIRADNPSPMRGDGTNTYLVGSRALLCIDPGPESAEHIQAINDALTHGRGTLAGVLLTHGHLDHAPAALPIHEAFGAPIYGGPGLALAHRTLNDGDVVPLDDGSSLVALHTPGHAPEHLCFFHAPTGTLFSGDLLLGHSSVLIAPPGGDMARYLASLRRLRALPLRRILPGHGPPIENPAERIEADLQRRIRRERQILESLADGRETPEQIAAHLYAHIDPSLRRAAERQVLAHLLKLVAEGRVARVEGDDTPRFRLRSTPNL